MNCVDYLFEDILSLQKELILGTDESISYNIVIERSLQLAKYLQQEIGTGKNILLVSQNSSFFIISYFGILKSGNICIPLNPNIEQRNLNFILKKTKCSLGFISCKALKKLDVRITTISESNFSDFIENTLQKEKPEYSFDGNEIAEIIFTSGSTSKPKGVMLTHNNIISNTRSIIQYLKLNENDIIQVVLPFYYCYGLSLLHTHIRVGGQIVINNNFIFLSTTIRNMNKYKCTGFAGVPSHFQILLRKTELFKKTRFTSLRYVTQAGGKLHNCFIKEFIQNFPNILFYVMYGQTEATARLSFLPPHLLKNKIGSIGKGIPGVELMVVGVDGKMIKPGAVGEIIAKGENIMAGYFDAQTDTDQSIRNGWLYTGDIGTIDSDGYIYLTARKKEIIKVGGNRISPKEIEEVISMIPGVIDCTIEGLNDKFLGEGIKATIVINKKDNQITPNYIKEFCSLRLSAFKIPGEIAIKESMVLNPTGKKIKSLE